MQEWAVSVLFLGYFLNFCTLLGNQLKVQIPYICSEYSYTLLQVQVLAFALDWILAVGVN